MNKTITKTKRKTKPPKLTKRALLEKMYSRLNMLTNCVGFSNDNSAERYDSQVAAESQQTALIRQVIQQMDRLRAEKKAALQTCEEITKAIEQDWVPRADVIFHLVPSDREWMNRLLPKLKRYGSAPDAVRIRRMMDIPSPTDDFQTADQLPELRTLRDRGVLYSQLVKGKEFWALTPLGYLLEHQLTKSGPGEDWQERLNKSERRRRTKAAKPVSDGQPETVDFGPLTAAGQ